MWLIPIRCMSCNNLIADKWSTYVKLLNEGHSNDEIFEHLGISKKMYCCRRMFLGSIDVTDILAHYK